MSEIRSHYDLVVVGGGPAGSALAALVAMAGHKVLLLERLVHPRYQIGESLLPATVHGVCAILGVEQQLHAAGFIRKNGAALKWGASPEMWGFGFSQSKALDEIGANFAYQVERCKFDQILFENARGKGVDIVENCTVRGVLTEAGRVVGVRYDAGDGTERIVRARYVADASGNGSAIHEQVGKRVHSEFFRNFAIFGYFENAGRLAPPNQGNIICEAFDRGWCWLIPLRNGETSLTSVGVVLASSQLTGLESPEATYLENLARTKIVSGLLKDATRVTDGMYGRIRTRRDWSYTSERFWAPGMLLLGDAACFVDPVLSTGVHLATYSALLAARSINTCLAGAMDEQHAFDEFEARYRREYEMFYNFLIAFYDMHRDEASYYWQARKVLKTGERDNEAFVQLVAGSAMSADIYIGSKHGIGAALQGFADQLDLRVPMETRADVTPRIGQRLQQFEVGAGGAAQLHAGLEDVRRASWGTDAAAAEIRVPSAVLQPSADHLHWAVSQGASS
jgi:halogenation protein CepH